jgi:prevent-host-death family protein
MGMQQYAIMHTTDRHEFRRENMSRQAVIKASEGHRAFGKLLKRVYRSDEHLIVERDGFPVAVLMSYQEYQNLNREHALETFKQFSRDLGREVEKQGLTEEQLLHELKETRQEIYKEQYGDLDE